MRIPIRSTRWTRAVPAALVMASGACASAREVEAPREPPMRTATETPARFAVPARSPADSASAAASPGTAACFNPLVDPRDGTRLTLVRSQRGMGDYAVPFGRYGSQTGELLRVECATGRVVGLVRR